MKILTWYSPSTDTVYVSTMANNPNDYAISNRPDNLVNAKYNPDTQQWERVFEEVTGEDFSIGEIDRLLALARQSDDTEKQLLANMLLKLLDA